MKPSRTMFTSCRKEPNGKWEIAFAKVMHYTAPAPDVECIAPASTVCTAPRSVVEYVVPAPAVSFVAPARVVEFVAPAPEVLYAAV